jgi:hypothetical protein
MLVQPYMPNQLNNGSSSPSMFFVPQPILTPQQSANRQSVVTVTPSPNNANAFAQNGSDGSNNSQKDGEMSTSNSTVGLSAFGNNQPDNNTQNTVCGVQYCD